MIALFIVVSIFMVLPISLLKKKIITMKVVSTIMRKISERIMKKIYLNWQKM